MPRLDDSTAYASNWWQVLLVDALLGFAVVVVALWLADGVARVVFVLAGAVYVLLVGRRMLRWARLRRDAGLS